MVSTLQWVGESREAIFGSALADPFLKLILPDIQADPTLVPLRARSFGESYGVVRAARGFDWKYKDSND